jgi:hypothetical protein
MWGRRRPGEKGGEEADLRKKVGMVGRGPFVVSSGVGSFVDMSSIN